MCAVYGWTPDYCLDHLSWSQVIMYHAYAIERENGNPASVAPAGAHQSPPPESDEPDSAAIERELGTLIRRGGDADGR